MKLVCSKQEVELYTKQLSHSREAGWMFMQDLALDWLTLHQQLEEKDKTLDEMLAMVTDKNKHELEE